MSNIIDAIYNLVNRPIVEIVDSYSGKNRANNAGDALEEYIKDLFANSFDFEETSRIKKWSEEFSYLGNNSNPPDAMLHGGDAIEIKKIESDNSALALNSSYPKQRLYSSSTMISNACKDAEEWNKKDMIYAVGVVRNNSLQHLSMVYGLDYCANKKCYQRIKSTIKNGIETISGVEFAKTNELARVNKVDPLGITYLRIRGMWVIENPWTVFNYVYQRDHSKKFDFMCIINQTKWEKFPNKELLETIHDERFDITDVKIKSPDNPAKLVKAKLITFYIDKED